MGENLYQWYNRQDLQNNLQNIQKASNNSTSTTKQPNHKMGRRPK